MPIERRRLTGWLILAVSLLAFPSLLAAQTGGKSLITRPIDEKQVTVLKGNTYPLALPKYDRGPAPPSLPMDRMLLVLKRSPAQEAALDVLLQSQQVKSSPEYHHWLAPTQFGAEFGPSDQDLQVIVGWLQSHGFQVDRLASGRGEIEFSGSSEQVQQAFHTEIHQYVVKGKSYWANDRDAAIPAALSPAVAGIVSLDNFPRRSAHRVAGIFRKSRTTGKVVAVQPAYNTGCNSLPCYAVGPYDFATIYDVLPLWNQGIDGTGETIAIVARSDIDPNDLASFRSLFGLPPANLQIFHNGPDPGFVNGDETESDLDVEWSSAVAKAATIDFVVSESTETTDGVDLSAEYIVDHDLAPVMSVSYQACELELGSAGNQFYSQLWQQAAAEGITVMVASGDGGSAVCDVNRLGASHGLSVNGIASTPYNVAVGGTDFNDASNPATYWNLSNDPTTQASAKGYIPETTWNDTCTNAELQQVPGGSSNAEANCNNSTLLSEDPSLLLVVGGSGGASNCVNSKSQDPTSCSSGYAKPTWQTGTGVPSDSARDVPDISLFASDGFNGNFYIVCEADAVGGAPCGLTTGEFLGVGGTSASSPAFAGIMALVDQKTQARQGDADYVLYPLAAKSGASCTSSGTPANSCVFYDTVVGTIAMPCLSGSPGCKTSSGGDSYGVLPGFNAAAAYDLATGLGSLNAANLVNAWSSVSFQPSSTTLQLNEGNPVTVTHGTPVNFNIAVSPSSPSPTGAVALIASTVNGPVQVGAFALSSGAASGATSGLPGGSSYSVTAHYPGNGALGASDSNSVTVTVTPEASKAFANLITGDSTGKVISFSASSATYGVGFFLLRVDVGDSSASYSSTTGISSTCSNRQASCPTGSVLVTANGMPLAGGALALNSNGFAEDQSLSAGNYSITASYPGDASYGSSLASASFTIAKAPTTASVSVPLAPVQYGQTLPVSALVSTTSNGDAPTGTFTFLLNSSPMPASSVVYEGRPFDPTTMPPAFASYSASGNIEFLAIGSAQLTAQYSGDMNYAASTSTPVTVAVTPGQPTFAIINANPAQVNASSPVKLSTTMYGAIGGAAPSGSITFYDGTTALSGNVSYMRTAGTASLSAALVASMSYTPTTTGTHSITAKYSGDTDYSAATSPVAYLTVTGADFAFSSQANPVTISIDKPGDTGTSILTVSAANGFSGTISFSAACPPATAELTCTLNPATVNLGGASASTTLTVGTTAPSLLVPGADGRRLLWPGDVVVAAFFAGLCLIFLLVWRTKSQQRWSTAACWLVILCVATWSGCSGGSGSQTHPPGSTNAGTPPGTYNVVVTGTSGNLTHTMNIPVIVQQ